MASTPESGRGSEILGRAGAGNSHGDSSACRERGDKPTHPSGDSAWFQVTYCSLGLSVPFTCKFCYFKHMVYIICAMTYFLIGSL